MFSISSSPSRIGGRLSSSSLLSLGADGAVYTLQAHKPGVATLLLRDRRQSENAVVLFVIIARPTRMELRVDSLLLPLYKDGSRYASPSHSMTSSTEEEATVSDSKTLHELLPSLYQDIMPSGIGGVSAAGCSVSLSSSGQISISLSQCLCLSVSPYCIHISPWMFDLFVSLSLCESLPLSVVSLLSPLRFCLFQAIAVAFADLHESLPLLPEATRRWLQNGQQPSSSAALSSPGGGVGGDGGGGGGFSLGGGGGAWPRTLAAGRQRLESHAIAADEAAERQRETERERDQLATGDRDKTETPPEPLHPFWLSPTQLAACPETVFSVEGAAISISNEAGPTSNPTR